MLTKEALKERMWGGFPAMRILLEDKRVPDRFYGHSSVSDNIFQRTERLIEIIILVREYVKKEEIMQNENVRLLYKDIDRLRQEIADMERFFREAKEDVQEIM